jgi:hypothetical protein
VWVLGCSIIRPPKRNKESRVQGLLNVREEPEVHLVVCFRRVIKHRSVAAEDEKAPFQLLVVLAAFPNGSRAKHRLAHHGLMAPMCV